MDLSVLILFFVYLVNLGLLIFALFFKDRTRSWPFFWMIFLIVVWQTTELLNVFWFVHLDSEILLFSVRAGLLPALFLPPVFIRLVYKLFDRWNSIKGFKKFLWCLPAVVMSFFVFTPYNLDNLLVDSYGRFFYITGPLWYFFAAYFVVAASYGLYFLIKNRKSSGPIIRRQINYILIASGLAAFGGLMFNIVLPIFGLQDFYYLGVNSTIFFTAIVTYALFRYRFFNLKIYFYQSLINSFKLFITFFVYYLLYTLLHAVMKVDFTDWHYLAFLILVVVFSAPFVFTLVHKGIVALLINPANDIKVSSDRVAKILRSGRDLDILLSRLAKEISQVVDYREIFIYLSKKKDANIFYQVFPVGERLLDKADSELIKYLARKKQMANLAEIEYFLNDKMLIQEMKESRVDIALPIFYNKQLLGSLMIDNDRKLLSIQELEFLAELNKYLDIAVGSLLLYQQDMAERK